MATEKGKNYRQHPCLYLPGFLRQLMGLLGNSDTSLVKLEHSEAQL